LKAQKIPDATIIRLSVYSRYLKQLEKNGLTTVSSGTIAEGVDGSPAQVRKDLAYFGEFGTRGVGYNVSDLNRYITKILGIDTKWNVIIVGAGNLGSALSQYKGFEERGFNVVALFDNDPKLIGQKSGAIPVCNVSGMPDFIRKNNIQIGLIAVPAPYAQDIVDAMVAAGVKAVLNFAPRVISVPDDVEYRNVDLAVNMEVLTFNMTFQK
jgi:redox-sensing transcriptional repressor